MGDEDQNNHRDRRANKVVKWGKMGVEAAGMLKGVVDREEDMSTSEAETDMVEEGFLACHRGQIQAAVAQDGSSKVDMDLKHSISVL